MTVGIVGYGHIGRRVHELLRPFGSQVLIFDPFLSSGPTDAKLVGLDELLQGSDVVTIHVPLTESTRGLVGERELGLMRPTAIIVNTARAEIVDQAALRTAVTSGGIAGAALDVFDSEPLGPQDPFVTSERTTITPHLAGTTRQAFRQGPIWIGERMQSLG